MALYKGVAANARRAEAIPYNQKFHYGSPLNDSEHFTASSDIRGYSALNE